MAVAMSDGAISGVPLTSRDLSGSVGSAATRSHSTRSADCGRAADGSAAAINADRPMLQAIEAVRDRCVMTSVRVLPNEPCEEATLEQGAWASKRRGESCLRQS